MQEHIIYRNCIIEIKYRLWWWNGKPYLRAGLAMKQIDEDMPRINKWLGPEANTTFKPEK